MSTPTPPGDVSVTSPTCPACGTPLPAGRAGASAQRPAGRPPTAGATKQSRRKSSCHRAGHGCKAPSTSAPNARPAIWPSNGALTAQPCQRLGAGGICPAMRR
jgi:hypothetical protein